MKLTPAQREQFGALFQAQLLDEGVYFPSGDRCVEAPYRDLERWIFEVLEELDEVPLPEDNQA
jgi:hypothetical protein